MQSSRMCKVLPTTSLARGKVFQTCDISTGSSKAVAWRSVCWRVALCRRSNVCSSICHYPFSQRRHLLFNHGSTSTYAYNNAQSLLSVSKSNRFQYRYILSAVAKKSCSTLRRISSSNSNGNKNSGDGDTEKAETVDEAYHSDKTPYFVHVEIPIDEKKSERTKVNVKPGSDIDDIRKELKRENSNTFASLDVVQIKLFTSADDQDEPLDALEKWKPGVTWGTEAMPLVVKVNQPLIPPSITSNGMC